MGSYITARFQLLERLSLLRGLGSRQVSMTKDRLKIHYKSKQKGICVWEESKRIRPLYIPLQCRSSCCPKPL